LELANSKHPTSKAEFYFVAKQGTERGYYWGANLLNLVQANQLLVVGLGLGFELIVVSGYGQPYSGRTKLILLPYPLAKRVRFHS